MSKIIVFIHRCAFPLTKNMMMYIISVYLYVSITVRQQLLSKIYWWKSVLWIRGVIWNAPKSMWKMILSCDCICPFIWNAPKSKNFIFGSFSVSKLITWLFWKAHFFHFHNQIGNLKSETFEKSMWSIWKQKSTRKWNSSILEHFKIKFYFHHMTKSSFTFSGISYYFPYTQFWVNFSFFEKHSFKNSFFEQIINFC